MLPLPHSVITERKVIRELLLSYKHHDFLWNTTHELYGNSGARKQAYAGMLETYKLLVANATIESLKKKIDNLRASYKRERKKVLNNPDHVPSLWYYRYLKFLHEGITVATYSGEEDESEDEFQENSEDGENSSSHLLLLTTKVEDNSSSQICRVVGGDVDEGGEGEPSTSQICHVLVKNPDMKIDYTPEESTYTIKSDVPSETDAFGRTLGLQLSELSPMQKTIAEKLISDVIFYGRLDKLTTKTSLINVNEDLLD